MPTTNAEGARGFLLNTRNDGTFVFRVYDPEDPGQFKDYELKVDDLEIEIVSGYYRLVDDPHDTPRRVDYARGLGRRHPEG